MESFLSKNENSKIEEIIKNDDDDYQVNIYYSQGHIWSTRSTGVKVNIQVDINWNIPEKETCDVGENTVVSVRNQINRRLRHSLRQPEVRPPWKKWVKPDDDSYVPSVIHRK